MAAVPRAALPERRGRFLLDRPGRTTRRRAAELAEELGDLPLALEQAAAFMIERARLADYLADFRAPASCGTDRRPGRLPRHGSHDLAARR